MSKAKSGGGATMNKVRSVGVRAGPPSTKVISVSAAASIGRSKGNHVGSGGGKTVTRPADPLVQGTRPQVPMGNAVALNVGKGGPGKGYVLHGQSGSQSQHGPARQPEGGSAPTQSGPGSFGFKGSK